MNHIGLLNEQPLHAALKAFYAQPPAHTEELVNGYVIDVVRDGVLIEIQTGNFTAIKHKLQNLLQHHPVQLVYPIAVEKWIVKTGQPGRAGEQRRKSPKRGRPVDVFAELVSIPDLAMDTNFSLVLALIWEEEVRRYSDKKRRRYKGWQTVERRLIKVLAQRTFYGPGSFVRLLPPALPEAFTTADMAAGLNAPLWLAQKMAYCLREMGTIEQVGKQGRSSLYARAVHAGL